MKEMRSPRRKRWGKIGIPKWERYGRVGIPKWERWGKETYQWSSLDGVPPCWSLRESSGFQHALRLVTHWFRIAAPPANTQIFLVLLLLVYFIWRFFVTVALKPPSRHVQTTNWPARPGIAAQPPGLCLNGHRPWSNSRWSQRARRLYAHSSQQLPFRNYYSSYPF